MSQQDGNFLDTEHTARHFREDHYPTLTERQHYDHWDAEGSLSLRERTSRRVDQILAEHQTPSLDAGVLGELRSFVAAG